MISFYISFKRLRLKRKGLSDARVVPLTKKEDLQYILCKDLQSLKSISDE